MEQILSILALFSAIGLMGCCCGSTPGPQTAYCPYGTYGESCTKICDAMRGTDYDSPDCVSECNGIVVEYEQSSPDACCPQNIRQGCASMCNTYLEGLRTEYFDVMEPGEMETMFEECNGECMGPYSAIGVDVDSVCAIGVDIGLR